MPIRLKKPIADLHNHLGSSVHTSILWSIAHRQGIRLPTKDFLEFDEMLTMGENDRNRDLMEMHNRFFHWTELIQSSPEAIEEAVKNVISGGYRKSGIELHELRFNPMKRNRKGERDLDHIIMASLWGMDKALLEYPQVRAGIILMMDRTFPVETNEIIINKAIKYRHRGVIGVDLAGPNDKNFSMREHRPLFLKARRAGLGITVHTGEENQLEEMEYVVSDIRPDRIGHGVEAAQDRKLMAKLVRHDILLELCPTSNLRNSVFENVEELKTAYQTLANNGVHFAVCTDGPEMYQTFSFLEQNKLVDWGVFSRSQINQANRWAFQKTFVG